MKQSSHLISCAVLLATFFWASGCASSQPQAQSIDERRSDVHLQAGVSALENRDYTGAMRNLTEALKFTPKSARILTNLGIAYAGKGELARAEESWRKALQLDPNFNDARLNLGILYKNNKRYPESERLFKEAAKNLSYDKLHQVAYNLALVYLHQGKSLLAEQQLKISVRENSTYCPAWLQLGLLQKERGDYSEAAHSLKGSVLGTCYKNPQAHYEIANLYLKAHETQLAKTKFLEIIQLFPASEWASRSEATLNMIR